MLTARAEVTDRMLIFGERHLRLLLAQYAAHYEIDLNAKHAQQLRDALAAYVRAGRRVSGGSRTCRPRRPAPALDAHPRSRERHQHATRCSPAPGTSPSAPLSATPGPAPKPSPATSPPPTPPHGVGRQHGDQHGRPPASRWRLPGAQTGGDGRAAIRRLLRCPEVWVTSPACRCVGMNLSTSPRGQGAGRAVCRAWSAHHIGSRGARRAPPGARRAVMKIICRPASVSWTRCRLRLT